MNAQTLTLLRAELKRDEGVRLKPYRDLVGKLTIGTGRNLDDMGITENENNYLLNNDIFRVQAELTAYLPWWQALDAVRQRVLANMCFNLGINKLLGFQHSLYLVQIGQYDQAAEAMLQSHWAKQVGVRAVRLAEMMRRGEGC